MLGAILVAIVLLAVLVVMFHKKILDELDSHANTLEATRQHAANASSATTRAASSAASAANTSAAAAASVAQIAASNTAPVIASAVAKAPGT